MVYAKLKPSSLLIWFHSFRDFRIFKINTFAPLCKGAWGQFATEQTKPVMRTKQTQNFYSAHSVPFSEGWQVNREIYGKLATSVVWLILLAFLPQFSNAQNPTAGNQGFQILSEGNFTFTGYTHVHGALGVGGNLTLNCSGVLAEICMDGVSSYVFPGDGTTTTGLLVKGGVTWTNGGAKVMGGKYMHIGNSTGCIQSDNGTNMATQVLPTGGVYNQAKRIEGALDQTPSPSPFQAVSFDFASLFNGYRASSQSLAACSNNVQLYNASNVAIASNNVTSSQNVQINSLANGVNVLNLTPTSLNNINELKFNAGGMPSATKLLVINVPLSANYVWNNRNMPGLSGSLHGSYIFWNFSGTTTYNLTINTASLIIGTVFAPNHNLIKTGTGDIDGGLFAKTITLGNGEIHLYNFSGSLPGCGSSENCVNGVDDDGDGLIDCADNSCPCSNCSTTTFFTETFGTGARTSTPYTNYCYEDGTGNDCMEFAPSIQINDGEYAIAQAPKPTSSNHDWTTDGDHTGDVGGRLMVVNADLDPGEFYRRTITGIVPNVDVTVDLWLRNTILPGYNILKPNVTFKLENTAGVVLGSVSTGDIPEDNTWHNYVLNISPGNVTAVVVVLVNNGPGGTGNDLGLDDIVAKQILQPAAPTVTATCASPTATVTVSAPLGANFQYSLNGTTYQSSPTFTGVATGTYNVRVRNTQTGCVSNPTSLTVVSPATISTQPTGGTICAGFTHNLNVAATGATSYQWQISTDNTTFTDIAGATASNYNTGNIPSTRYYQVKVFNGASCFVTSSKATVTVQSCAEVCSNGIDDDGDGLADCLDTDCTPNNITNNEFNSGTTGWSLANQTGNTSTFTVNNTSQLSGTNSAFINISTATGTNWHIQFLQGSKTIVSGKRYRVSFQAKATANRNASVMVQQTVSPYTGYWLQNFALTTTAQTFDYTFTAGASNAGQAGLYFNFGESTADVYLDNIVFREACNTEICNNGVDDDGDGLVDALDTDCNTCAFIGQNLIVNGEFDNGNTGFTSNYVYTPINSMCGNWGIYGIGKSINQVGAPIGCNNSIWAASDRNGPSGNFMLIDPSNATGVNDRIWSQTVTVCPNTNYVFSVWTKNMYYAEAVGYSGVDPNFSFTINGAAIPGASFTMPRQVLADSSKWIKVQGIWNSGSATSAVLNIVNIIPGNLGNDLAIDGLFFGLCGKTSTISASGTNACASAAVTLSASAQTTTSGWGFYEWLKNGVVVASGTTATTYSATTAGTYKLRCYTTPNSSGCPQESNAIVLTSTGCPEVCNNSLDDDGDGLVDCADPNCPAPVAGVSGTNSICTGGSTTLTASGGGTYSWSTGATSASINVNPAITTTYTVTVTGASGCTSTASRTVTVNANPTGSIVGTNTICPGASTTLTASGGSTYLWSTGATNASISVSPASTTTYTVTVTSTPGCTATATRTVTVNPATLANAGADVTICSGASTSLTASGAGGTAPYTYAWSGGLGNVASVTANPTSTTTYTVTVTSNNGCTGTDQVVVNVNASPVASAGSNVTVCSGTSVNLSASASGGVSPFTYTWDNSLGAGASKSVTPTTTTIYSVTVTGANSCTNVAQVSVNVNAVPTANAGADATICQGQSTNLSATGSGAPGPFSYAWSNGYNGNAQTVTPGNTTTYTVSVTSSNGCVGTDQKLVTVQVCSEICNNNQDDDGDGLTDCADSDCGPSANAGTDLTICPGGTAFMSVGVTGGSSPYTYAWSNGLGSGASKNVSPAATTTYSVTVTAASGCTSTDQITVTVMPCSEDCTNGIDDDGDGLVDCADPDCAGVTAPVLMADNYTTCPGMNYSNRVTYNDNNLNNPLFSIAADPVHGTVTIDWTGKFIYVPNGFDCVTDQFTYQVCNQSTGCCASANVTIVLGDNTAPQLMNIPADITINCDDAIPLAPTVTGFDQCPGIYMDFDETTTQSFVGACGSYTITRTWTATDFCGNTTTDNQLITVVDLTKPELFKVHTLSDGSRMVAGVAQRVTQGWKYIRFPITFKTMPVVLTNPTTNSDIAPVVVQVRNVSRQGFEVRLREEEAADGAHGNENVSWVAVEPGLSATGLKWEAGTLANVDHLGDTIIFKQTYGASPIFLPSALTNAQTDPATIRLTFLDNQRAELFEQEEASADAEVIRLNETVGYMAIEPGQVLVDEDGATIGEAGKVNITSAWATVSLTGTYTKPVVIIGGVTNAEGQPITYRVRNVTSKKFDIRLQEWSYLDGIHTPEAISWMVVEGSVPGERSYYCEGRAGNLVPNVNIMALDNCDDLVEFAFDQNSSVEGAGLLTNYSWTAIDDCGNTSLIARLDTCIVAALKLKANLSGAFISNGGTNMMRDDLRKEEYIPMVEPYSEMPSYPHVAITHPTVTICHHPGQADQVQMEVAAAELNAYLAEGDEIGSCGLPPATLPTGAANATYRTKANGNWNDPATWVGGNIPTPFNNLNNMAISIEHMVTVANDNVMLKNNCKVYITNGGLSVPNGYLRLQNAELFADNATLDIKQELRLHSGTCKLGIKNSSVKVGGDFINVSGVRKLENVCMEIGQNYECGQTTNADTLINATLTIDGQVRLYNSAKMHLDNAKFRVINGNFLVELGCKLSGNHMTMLMENGIVLNLGFWTANIDQYCVAGLFTINFSGTVPAIEDCANLTDYFLSCDPDNIFQDANNGGGGSTGTGGNTNTTSADGPVAGSEGVLEPTVLEEQGNGAVVDWLLLELRDKDNPAKIKGYSTVLLKRDGSIVSETGEPVICFKKLLEGEYLVSIRHRNHLGQMTLNPVFLTIMNPPTVDFTDPNLALAGGASSGRIVGGKRFMWGGDLNGDGKVIYQGPNNDVFRLFSRILSEEDNIDNLANFIVPGYEHADFNMDGKVIYQGPNNDRSPLLYNSILVHSSNTSMLANYIVMDFIP